MRIVVASTLAVASLLCVEASARAQVETSPRRPEVRALVLSAGDRDGDALREHVEGARPALARCDRSARALPGERQLTVRLEITERGRAATSIRSSVAPPARSDAWQRCVAGVLSRLRFGPGSRAVLDVVVALRFDDPSESPGVVAAPPMIPAAPWGGRPLGACSGRPCPGSSEPVPAQPLSREDIQRIVREHLAPIQRCYERALAERSDVSERVVVTFTIAGDGSVVSAEAADEALATDPLATCVRHQLRSLRFPAHRGPAVQVRYPFVFRAESEISR